MKRTQSLQKTKLLKAYAIPRLQSVVGTSSLCFVFLLSLFATNACSLQNQSIPVEEERSEISIGSTAFDFTLKSSKKDNIRFNEQRGKIVLLNFWAAWSGSSTRLLSQFETLYQKRKDDDLVVISINIDPATAKSVLNKQNPEHFILFDDDRRVSKMYQIETVPSIFLIDQSGKLVLHLEGFDPRYHDIIQNKIEKLLVTEKI